MYSSVKLCLVVLALVVLQVSSSPSRVRRQGFGWGDEDDFDFNVDRTTRRQRPTQGTSTTTQATNGASTTTTASPEYNNCVRQCPKLPQYNPVCGTDRITYPNDSHLNCAKGCGLNVERLRGGTCAGL